MKEWEKLKWILNESNCLFIYFFLDKKRIFGYWFYSCKFSSRFRWSLYIGEKRNRKEIYLSVRRERDEKWTGEGRKKGQQVDGVRRLIQLTPKVIPLLTLPPKGMKKPNEITFHDILTFTLFLYIFTSFFILYNKNG